MPLEKIEVRPAYKIVFDEIEQRIAAGEFPIGQQLPTETELSETLGVNRSTIREGIRLLEENGLVERRAGRRLFVTVPRVADLATRSSRAMVLNKVTFQELWEVMMVLEPEAARLAAGSMSDRQLALLEHNVRRTREAVREKRSLVELDSEFHVLISEASGNRVIQLAREPIGTLLYAANDIMMPKVPQSGRRLLEAHEAILAGLQARDQEQVELWMRRHISDFRRGYDLAGLDMLAAVTLPRTQTSND